MSVVGEKAKINDNFNADSSMTTVTLLSVFTIYEARPRSLFVQVLITVLVFLSTI